MNVIVCIKQVPSGSVCLNEQGNLDRSRAGGEINPGDKYALEAGMQIAERTGGQVTAVTMGPEAARGVLQTAFSMGASRGILVSHPSFAGGDVYATAYTLSQCIRRIPDWDLILCGQQSTDGDTAQLPFSLAVQLGIPAVGWVKHMEICPDRLILQQELSQGTQRAEIAFPAVIAVGAAIGTPRIPSLRSQLRAKSMEIQVMGPESFSDPNPENYVFSGSHTRVVGVRQTESRRKHAPMSGAEGVCRIRRLLREVQTHG